jgi:hypothetical protein
MVKASSKKSTKKVQRHYPVDRVFRLKDPTGIVVQAGGRTIQAANILSAGNRRLYRQSRVYSMKIDAEPDSNQAQNGVEVFVLRDTYDLHGAYKMAMQKYYNAMKEELQAGGAQTRWHDFRASADYLGSQLTGSIATPQGGVTTMVDNDLPGLNVDLSTVEDQNGVARNFSLSFTSTTLQKYGILEEFLRQNRVDNDPATASTDLPYDGLDPGMDEANYDILRQSGENPPYSPTVVTSQWRRVCRLQQTAGGAQKLSTGFFDAPLGIVLLVSNTFGGPGFEDTYGMSVTFQAGDYKGVKAPAYATPVLTEAMEYEVV